MKPANAIRAMGPTRYVATFGLGAFGGWMFAVFCFIYTLQGVELTLRKLELTLAVAATVGILWGGAMWYLFVSRLKQAEPDRE